MSNLHLVFLDIDGVLNSERMADVMYGGLETDCVTRLNRITADPDVQVVISSSWRKHYGVTEIYDQLRVAGFNGRIAGHTPALDNKTRGEEIALYLRTFPARYLRPITSIVVFDDDEDISPLSHRLVRTDYKFGLRDQDIDRALAILRDRWDPDMELPR